MRSLPSAISSQISLSIQPWKPFDNGTRASAKSVWCPSGIGGGRTPWPVPALGLQRVKAIGQPDSDRYRLGGRRAGERKNGTYRMGQNTKRLPLLMDE